MDKTINDKKQNNTDEEILAQLAIDDLLAQANQYQDQEPSTDYEETRDYEGLTVYDEIAASDVDVDLDYEIDLEGELSY